MKQTEGEEKRRLWHIGDTHGYHNLLTIPSNIWCVVHSGDASNSRSPYANEHELKRFIKWFGALPIEHKIFCPGNHETSIPKGLVTRNDFIAEGITYLEDDFTYIDEFKIHGSPWTPTFGYGWAWNRARNALDRTWQSIDEDVDILITHGPPKGCLDTTLGRGGDYEGRLKQEGCTALRRHILTRIKPKLSLFGHMHNREDIINAGTLKFANHDTIFSNGSVVTDNKFGILTSNGNIFEL